MYDVDINTVLSTNQWTAYRDSPNNLRINKYIDQSEASILRQESSLIKLGWADHLDDDVSGLDCCYILNMQVLKSAK